MDRLWHCDRLAGVTTLLKILAMPQRDTVELPAAAVEVRYVPLLAGPDLVKPVPPCSKYGSIRQYGPWCECPPSTDARQVAN